MPGEKSNARAVKERRRQARGALEAYLTKLRNACDSIEKIEQWTEQTKVLENILQQYEDALPENARAHLKQAIKVAQGVTEGFGDACKVLKLDVQKVLPLIQIGATASLGTVLIGALILGAVVVGSFVATSAATAATLMIENRNCSDIQFPVIPVSIPGLDLPEGTLRAGQVAEAKIPFWVSMSLDATSSPSKIRAFFGTFDMPGNPTSVRLVYAANVGGEELLIPGKVTSANLSGKSSPRLVVACR